jgi:cyanophycinase
MTTVLIGGGWSESAAPLVYGQFLAAAGDDPVVACVVVDEGDGPEYFTRFEAALTAVAPCRPRPVLVPLEEPLSLSALDGADALLVCGGLTPAYGSMLGPIASSVRSWLAAGRPYAGFSAGAAVAAARALVGGYRLDGRVVCPPDAGEDREEISVVDGLGLVPFAVDVHAAQWGTLGRLCAAVSAGLVPAGVAVDEDTALVVSPSGSVAVVGAGAAHVVQPAGSGVSVSPVLTGGTIAL